MRGKRFGFSFPFRVFRITPADAGKTHGTATVGRNPQDHPRGCGENLRLLSVRTVRLGSPPRMRGKLFLLSRLPRRPRITPADAGKTSCINYPNPTARDHPRGCGENAQMGRMRDVNLGSPPRMRGKQRINYRNLRSHGITPADAGKTYVIFSQVSGAQDHPRGCGENTMTVRFGANRKGSPPRMRGKHLFILSVYFGKRITPADAGKTKHPF